MFAIVITLNVSKLDKSSTLNNLHSLNILLISVTWEELKFNNFISFICEHPENIPHVLFTLFFHNNFMVFSVLFK